MAGNITFDETKYNKLIQAMNDLEHGLLHKATITDAVVLDDEIVLQPNGQKWDPAVTLVTKGKAFGGSVDQQNEQLRQAIVKFRNALVAAKAVFKETNDLATYDINKFVSEYPDFNAGGGLTTGTPPPGK